MNMNIAETNITNESLQRDEIEALSAIFNEEWVEEDPNERVYSIQIKSSHKDCVYLQVIFPVTYPLTSPPNYRISAPWMSRNDKDIMNSELENIYLQHTGESIIYLWIEKIRDLFEETKEHTCKQGLSENKKKQETQNDVAFIKKEINQEASAGNLIDEFPTIFHGETITDKKSIFQAHVAKVFSIEQINLVLKKLKENRKIAAATHNISAYRIYRDKAFIQDCDDDGETKGGGVLLNLLQILDITDVFVVVSRWYGGIHLGPNRFKHIKNAARNVLSSSGFLIEVRLFKKSLTSVIEL